MKELLLSARTTRPALLACAGVISLGIVIDKTITRVPTFLTMLRGEPLPPLSAAVDTATVVREGVWIALAVIALGCLVLADGRAAAGLAASGRRSTVVFGAYLMPMVPIMVITGAVTAAVAYRLGIDGWVGNTGFDPIAGPASYWIYKSAMAGIVEEITVVVVAWRLLELIPARKDGRRFVDTGWATAVFIVLRLSYHCYYGVMMTVVIVMAWLVVRLYRNNRTLVPLIVAHFCYDALALLPLGRLMVLVVGSVALLACSPYTSVLSRVFGPFGFLSAQRPEEDPATAAAHR